MRRRDAMARINNKLTRTISFSIEINYGPSGGGGGGTSSSGEGVAGVPGRGGVGEPIKEESEDEGFHDSNTRPNSNEKVKGNQLIEARILIVLRCILNLNLRLLSPTSLRKEANLYYIPGLIFLRNIDLHLNHFWEIARAKVSAKEENTKNHLNHSVFSLLEAPFLL